MGTDRLGDPPPALPKRAEPTGHERDLQEGKEARVEAQTDTHETSEMSPAAIGKFARDYHDKSASFILDWLHRYRDPRARDSVQCIQDVRERHKELQKFYSGLERVSGGGSEVALELISFRMTNAMLSVCTTCGEDLVDDCRGASDELAKIDRNLRAKGY